MEVKYFKLGQITSAVGLKGEVKVYPLTDYIERFSELKQVLVEDEIFTIEKVRYQPNMAIIKFLGIDDRNAAEKLKNLYLNIKREDARELPEDTYYISDLIGLSVITEMNEKIGELLNVIQNTAQDLYEIKTTNESDIEDKFYLPAVEEFILDINMEKREMIVRIPEGLLN